ncbi:MAG: hypothetical protein N2691_05645 [Patescibacteria group bacterium]|nr:hypothetical protein [Patescibacteria group bacterium]
MKPQTKNQIRELFNGALWLLVFIYGFFSISPVQATPGIYDRISFQGKLVNNDGTNVTNGSYTFTFTLYNAASGGTSLWTEDQSITVTDGIFRAELGAATSFPANLFDDDQLFLAIQINGGSALTPRIRFAAVPYAFNAEKVNGLNVSNTTGTITVPSGETIDFGANSLTLVTSGDSTLTLPTTGTLATIAGVETFTNKTIGSTGLVFSGAGIDISSAVSEGIVIEGDADSAFRTLTGGLTFEAAGTGTTGRIQIGVGGAGNSAPDFLALSIRSTTGDPSGGQEGDMYYNTADNAFRCYQDTGWTNCITNSLSINSLSDATGTRTLANADYTQTWNWSSLTTQTGLVIGGGTAMTSGSTIATNGTYVHTTVNSQGALVQVSFTDASTNVNNGGVTSGLSISATVNTSGAGSKTINGMRVAPPTLTACSGGSCAVNALEVNAQASSNSLITQVGLQVNAASITSGAQYGIRIGDVSASGGATEVALRIGDGWDIGLEIESRILLTDNSTTALQVVSSSSTNTVFLVDASNERVGIGVATADYVLDVNGPARLRPLGSAPSAAQGVMYFDAGASKFRCSENGSSFVDCITAGLTVRETDASPSVASTTTLEFGPVTSSSDEFEITDQTGGVVRVRLGTKAVLTDGSQTLTNKTIGSSGLTFSGATTSITTTGSENFTIGPGGTGDVVIGSGGNTFTFDPQSGPSFAGTARPTKVLTLSPEYSGAVLSTFYGAGTDVNISGSMTSDTDSSANLLRNYYQWSSSQSSLNYYTVAVRIRLPRDFSEWAPSNAFQVDILTQTTAMANNVVDIRIYNGDDTPGTVVATSAGNVSSSANSWTTVTIDDSALVNGGAPEWDAADESAVIYLRVGSRNNNIVRLGDIRLTYLAAF